MRWKVATLLVLAVSLAGCADGGDDVAEPDTGPEADGNDTTEVGDGGTTEDSEPPADEEEEEGETDGTSDDEATEPQAEIDVSGPSAWPTFGLDVNRTASTGSGGPGSGDEIWSTEVDASSPAVVGDTVYVAGTVREMDGSWSGGLRALDVDTGQELWLFEIDAKVTASPTVADGIAYIGTATPREPSTLYAVDADTGQEQWRFEAGAAILSAATVAEGTVYVGSMDAKLTALDARTGEEQWTFATAPGTSPISESTAVHDGTVYASASGSLHAVDADTGEEQWSYDDGGASAPAVANQRVYAGTHDGLVAVDADTGQEQWTLETSEAVSWAPAVHEGTVYAGSLDDFGSILHAVDADTGEEQWSLEFEDRVLSPAVLGQTVYVAPDSLHALDASDGTERWVFEGSFGSDTASPAVVDGVALFPSDGITAVDAGALS